MLRRAVAVRRLAAALITMGSIPGLVLCLVLGFILTASVPSQAAGAFAIGKCGAYGKALDFPAEAEARAAARKNCAGDCKTVTMKRACAALSVDLTNPCGAHGYAVAPRISTTLNDATRKCYEYGGKECVIRAWACDARG